MARTALPKAAWAAERGTIAPYALDARRAMDYKSSFNQRMAPATAVTAPGPWHGKEDVLPMQGQPSGADVGVGRAGDEVEREVLALLLESGLPGPWPVWELGSEFVAADAV